MIDKNVSIGFADILLLIFIVLKLCHLINWSWWWVLSPVWIELTILIIVIIIGVKINGK